MHAIDYDCVSVCSVNQFRWCTACFDCDGKGEHESAEKILGGCVTVQVVISLILTVVILVWNKDLLLAFGASENTISYANSYMSLYAFGTLFVQLTLGMNAFITAQGFAKTRYVYGNDRCSG